MLIFIKTGGFDRALSDTDSIATRHGRSSEIIRRENGAFDTSDIAVGDRFPINTGFGIVTCKLVCMAPPTGLAEPDLTVTRYFLVLGGLVISR